MKEILYRRQSWSYSYLLSHMQALIAHCSLILSWIALQSKQICFKVLVLHKQAETLLGAYVCTPTQWNIVDLSENLISLFKSCAGTGRNEY